MPVAAEIIGLVAIAVQVNILEQIFHFRNTQNSKITGISWWVSVRYHLLVDHCLNGLIGHYRRIDLFVEVIVPQQRPGPGSLVGGRVPSHDIAIGSFEAGNTNIGIAFRTGKKASVVAVIKAGAFVGNLFSCVVLASPGNMIHRCAESAHGVLISPVVAKCSIQRSDCAEMSIHQISVVIGGNTNENGFGVLYLKGLMVASIKAPNHSICTHTLGRIRYQFQRLFQNSGLLRICIGSKDFGNL